MQIIVFDSVDVPGYDGASSSVEAYPVCDLLNALDTEYPYDAHFAPYHIPGEEYCPRINLPAFADADPTFDLIVWDVDHKDQGTTLPCPGAPFIVYETRAGWRLLLPHTCKRAEYDKIWHAGVAWLASIGITTDPQAPGVNRLYRLPKVVRDGEHLDGAWWRCPGEGTGIPFSWRDFALPKVSEKTRVRIGNIPDGERNDTLFRAGCMLKERGFPQESIEAAIHSVNTICCQPPLDDGALATLLGSVDRYDVGDITLLAFARPGEERTVRTGSEAELADMVLQEMDRLAGESVVFVNGSLMKWAGSALGWVEATSEFRRRLLKWDGAVCGKRRVMVSARMLKGALELAMVLRDKPEFWKPGVVIDGRINGRDAEASDRCRWVVKGPVGSCVRPYFTDMLEHQFGSMEDERVLFLQEFIGLCMAGQAYKHQGCLVLLGDGGNGKSTFIDAITQCFPSGSVSAIGPHLWSGYSLARLADSYLNVCADLPSKKMSDTDIFKQVIAGETVEARQIWQPPFPMTPVCGHLFAANTLPIMGSLPEGFWRRWHVIRWDQPIETMDREIGDKLRGEREGILTWILEGMDRVLARGYLLPVKSLEDEKARWQVNSSPIAEWLDEAELTPGFYPNDKLYSLFRSHCSGSGIQRIVAKREAISEMGKFGKISRKIINGKKVRGITF